MADQFNTLDIGSVSAAGTPGAPLPVRLVGATASGPPVSGTYAVGDRVTDLFGREYVCTAAGTPGTWRAVADCSSWRPSDYGWLGWTQDPATLNTTAWSSWGSGLLYAVNVRLERPSLVTGIIMATIGAGSGLVSGQCFAELRARDTTAVLGRTADQSTLWASVAVQKMPLSGGPVQVDSESTTVTWWANGTTMPQLRAGIQSGLTNHDLTDDSLRMASAASGITTAASSPATLGVRSAYTGTPWIGVY